MPGRVCGEAGCAVGHGEPQNVGLLAGRDAAAEAVAVGRDDQSVAVAAGCEGCAAVANRELCPFGQAVECAERNDEVCRFGRDRFGRCGADFMPD